MSASSRSIAWVRLGGEFAVIVIGVLVALAVDQWRNGVDARSLEFEYAERLKAALAADTVRLAEFEEPLATKAAVLRDLVRGGESLLDPNEPGGAINRLRISAYVAIPELRSEVFREMESSGSLGLIADVTLRDELGAYYAQHAFLSGVLQDSYGDYRKLMTGALPGDLWYSALVELEKVDQSEFERGVRALLSNPELETAANSELAYTATMTGYVRFFRAQAEALLSRLNEDYPPSRPAF